MRRTSPATLSLGGAFVASGLIAAAMLLSSCSSGSPPQKTDLTIGGPNSDAATLLYVAQDKGFFDRNGLSVTLKGYDTGLLAMDALLNDEIDVAGTGEYPLVTEAYAGADVSTIGSLAKSFNGYVVARTDSGIKNEADLKGKRVGLPLGTVVEFYLARSLLLNGLSMKDINPINLLPSQMADAIVSGDIDAAVVWEPYATQIEERAPNQTTKWLVQPDRAMFSILTCRNDWIGQHPDLVERLLKSLTEAEAFVTNHPNEAKAVLGDRGGHDAYFVTRGENPTAYVDRVWSQHQFVVSLDQSLVLALEDEARWTAETSGAGATIPNFLDYIYADGLKAVQPEAVAIVGK